MSRTYYKNRAQIARPSDTRFVPETYGIPAEQIAALCGVDIATARRWKRGTSRIPVAAKKLLAGDLGAFGKEWRGWKIVKGELVSPEGWAYPPGDLLALPFLRAQLATYQSKERIARELDEQPTAETETRDRYKAG